MNHEELVGLAKQHLSGVSFEYQDDAVPVLAPCRFTGSEVRNFKICLGGNVDSFTHLVLDASKQSQFFS